MQHKISRRIRIGPGGSDGSVGLSTPRANAVSVACLAAPLALKRPKVQEFGSTQSADRAYPISANWVLIDAAPNMPVTLTGS